MKFPGEGGERLTKLCEGGVPPDPLCRLWMLLALDVIVRCGFCGFSFIIVLLMLRVVELNVG